MVVLLPFYKRLLPSKNLIKRELGAKMVKN
nr:MAG TPA: hypothetical protein [Caudoviricetes sp.]DAX56911.1 MAG TPA: hypothetical protein [Caudoviricetes sp.]DAY21812.1 MAG TPA: hypothetical protein [Caudoviricetes sp.]